MYKHSKSKSRSALSLMCATVLSLSTLTGCTSSSSSNEPDRSVLPQSLQSMSFENHLDISIGYWNIEDMVKAAEPDGMTQYIEELFNITLHPMSVTWSNYKERYQILSATDSLPDVFATLTLSSNDDNDSATFTDLIETGSIQPLPRDMTIYPILNNMLQECSYTRHSDGQFYAVPRVSFVDPILSTTDAAMIVRRDWMDTLGFEDPQSFDEFADMVSAFALEDPDGNGLDDTLGYNVNTLSALGKWVILGIAPQCNVYSWVENDEQFVPSWTTDDFRNVVTAYRDLYVTGGLDPDFYSKSPSIVMEDFAAGRLGALEYKSSPSALMALKNKWDEMNPLPFEDCVDVLPIFPAPDGVRYSNSSNMFWSESYISSSADEEKVERILALFEFLLSEQGQELCRYGIEGVDYIQTDKDEYQCLLDTVSEQNESFGLNNVLDQKYPSRSLFSGIATWGGSWSDFKVNDMNTLLYGESCIELANKSAIWYQNNTTQLERPYAFLNFPKESTNRFSTSKVFNNFITCIIGKEDPLVMWDRILNDMTNHGLNEYIDRQNITYREND